MAETKTPTIEEQVAALAAALEEQKKISAEQAKTIADLKGSQLAEKAEVKAKPKVPKKNVTVGKKEYKWRLAHFIFDNAYVTAEDAALDKDLIAKILAVPGQEILIEQA